MARRRFSDIRPFFDKDQWSELGDYEKNSYQNSKENYEAMIKAGLAPRKPFFMMNNEERLAAAKPAAPAPKRPAAPKPTEPTRKSRRVQQLYFYDEDNKENPDEDELIFCIDCRKAWAGDCPVHKGFEILEDTKVAEDTPKDERILASLPPGLVVRDLESADDKKSGDDAEHAEGAAAEVTTRGVFAKVPLAKRTRLGPYEGDIPEDDEDPSPENNWMALVRDAAEARDLRRHVNLGPMEYGGRLYFVTLCDIPAGQELVIRFPPAFKVDTVCGREFGSAVTLSQHQRANASCAAELRRRRRALAELQRAKTSKPAAASTPPSSPGPRGRRRRREGDEDYSPRDHKPLLTRGQKRELRRELQELTMNQFLDVEKRIGQGEHDCPQCGLHFGRACRLRAHVQEQHLAADRSMRDRFSTIPFTCSACPANFSSPKDLRSHVKMTHFGLHKHDGGGLSEASTATTASGAASPRASPRASPAPSPAPSSAPSPAPSSAPSSAPTLAASDTASEVPSDAESESDSEMSDKPVAADSSLSSTTIETSMELDNSQDTSTESNP